MNQQFSKSWLVAINTHVHTLLDVDRLWCRDWEWNKRLFDGITDVVTEFLDDFIQIFRGLVIHSDLVWWHKSSLVKENQRIESTESAKQVPSLPWMCSQVQRKTHLKVFLIMRDKHIWIQVFLKRCHFTMGRMHLIIFYHFPTINSLVSRKDINSCFREFFSNEYNLSFYSILGFSIMGKKINIYNWIILLNVHGRHKKRHNILWKKKINTVGVPFVLVSGLCWWLLWPRPHLTCSGQGLYLTTPIPTETNIYHHKKIHVHVAIY